MRILLAIALSCVTAAAAAQPFAPGAPAFSERFAAVGEIGRRHARDIAANHFSVGVETAERGYSTPANWLPYLGPLGVKRARLMAGWARLERAPGRYDWSALDREVDGIIAQGVQPWVGLTYGNPAYGAEGGTILRDSALPAGPARTAWLAFAKAAARRYAGRVPEWEIWNEPDLNPHIDAASYGAFAAETARAVRAGNPRARIIFGGFTGSVLSGPEADGGKGAGFARDAFARFTADGGRADIVTYHGYDDNPDSSYAGVERFRALVRGFDPRIEVRQGENGAPSVNQQLFALRNLPWTEEAQAKWALRRMLGDIVRGVPTSIFTLVDLHYPPAAEAAASWSRDAAQRRVTWAKNSKGLLQTGRAAFGTAADDQRVLRPKMAYRAVQSLTAVFDSTLKPAPDACRTVAPGVTVHAFRRADGAALVAVWRSTDRPGERSAYESVDLDCPGLKLGAAPVYADLLTGMVYAVAGADGAALRALPIYDSPVILADSALVPAG